MHSELCPPIGVASAALSSPPEKAASSRRGHERVEANFDVTLESDHNFFLGFSENLSEGGVFVAGWAFSQRKILLGDRVQLSFTLPDSSVPIKATAEVRWVRSKNVSSETEPGLGLKFLDLPDEDRQRIERFVRRREPLFYPD